MRYVGPIYRSNEVNYISFIDKSTTCILRYSSTPIPDLNIRFWRQENFSHGYSLPDLITIKSGERNKVIDLISPLGNLTLCIVSVVMVLVLL